ncbi:MAG: alpha/beta fold hydrolase [Dehalococcoidia bacterium]|nr:alpha/beta fold hydrolase [Dehalococcoidia bacterium]
MPDLRLAEEMVLHYETWGDPEAPALVLLHGFTGDLRTWAGQVEPFSRDYFVVAPDLPGHGLSTAPEDPDAYALSVLAEDVRALLDSLTVEVCALVGSSFGGMVSLQFATLWPERVAALVVSDASASREHPDYAPAFYARERQIAADEETVLANGVSGLARRAGASIKDPFLAAGAGERYARMSTAGYLGCARARRERPDLVPVLAARLTMPVLLCTGERDPVRSAMAVIGRELPGARQLTFRDTGHAVPLARTAAYTAAVLDFLADVEEGRSVAGARMV